MTKNILIVSEYFWPENFRTNEIVLQLKKMDYNIAVVTSVPYYPDRKQFLGNDWLNYESILYEDINIYRNNTVRRSGGKVNLFLNYIFGPIGLIFNIIKHRKKICDADVILTFQYSPIFTIFASKFAARLFKAKHIVWVFDVWPESLWSNIAFSGKGLSKYFAEHVCRFLYHKNDLILTQSRYMQRYFENKYDMLNIDTLTIHADLLRKCNCENCTELTVAEDVQNKDDVIKFIYAGNIGKSVPWSDILEAIAEVKLRATKSLKLDIVGSGSQRDFVLNLIAKLSLEDVVEVSEPINYDCLITRLSNYKFGVVALQDRPEFNVTIPAKLQSYAGAGLPVLSLCKGAVNDLVSQNKCGVVSGSVSKDAFSEAFLRALQLNKGNCLEMSQNSKALAERQFSMSQVMNKLSTTLDNVS